jgi:hypothetical protein
MAEQNTAKEGQVSEMNPRQTAETIAKAPVASGTPIASTPIASMPIASMPGPRSAGSASAAVASDGAGPDGPASGAMLEGDLQAHIGRQLRAVYEEVVNEEVPDRFVKLLEELERKKADRS